MTDHSDIILISFKIILWHFQFFKQHWHYEKMVKCVNVLKCQNNHEYLSLHKEETRSLCFYEECQSETEKWWYFLHVYFDKSKIMCHNLKSRFQHFLIFKETHSNLFCFHKQNGQIWMSFFENENVGIYSSNYGKWFCFYQNIHEKIDFEERRVRQQGLKVDQT